MKKIKILLIIIAVILAIFALLIGLAIVSKDNKANIITSSQLEKAIDISQLSTAEFVYNGVAEKLDDKQEKVECYISYNANVKVGIQMEEVKFDINEEEKTVKPILPEITVNIATLDTESISYIPKNPDVELKEIITLCKEDAINEANNSEKLYQTAEENLKSAIEALISPILDSAGYSIVW